MGTLAWTGDATVTGAVAISGDLTVHTDDFVVDVDGNISLAPTSGLATLAGCFTVTPTRIAGTYAYGVQIDGDELFFTGGAGSKSNLVDIQGERPEGTTPTGDSYDAVLKIAGTNYADSSGYIMRGLNGKVSNGDGGSMALIEHNLSVNGKEGSTTLTVRGLTLTAENYGTCATEFGGLDIVLKNEAAVATTEYGLRIRNLNNSIADAVAAAVLISDTGANTGWDYLLDANGASVVVADMRLHNGALINNSAAGTLAVTVAALTQSGTLGVTGDFTVNTDDFVVDVDGNITLAPTGKTVAITGQIDLDGTSTAAGGMFGVGAWVTQGTGVALTGTLRGGYFVATNGDTAATGAVRGIQVIARAADSDGTGNTVALLQGIYLEADAKNKTATTLRGLEVSLDGQVGGSSTTAQGIVVFNNSSAVQTTSIGVDINGGTATGHKAFTYDLRLQNGETISNVTDGKILLTATTVEASAALNVIGDLTVNTNKFSVTGTTGKTTITHTSASTDPAVSVEPFVLSSTMTGPAGVGGRARFALDTDVALGGWANALKAITTFGATGRVTGMASALCAEMVLSAGTTQGTYAPLESELNMATGASLGAATSFLYGDVGGTGAGEILDGAYLFELGPHCTIDTGHVVQTSAVAGVASTHAIKIRVAGTTLYIPAHTDVDFAT
jgi:hypothetical protein